jgi:hypothetical protein
MGQKEQRLTNAFSNQRLVHSTSSVFTSDERWDSTKPLRRTARLRSRTSRTRRA